MTPLETVRRTESGAGQRVAPGQPWHALHVDEVLALLAVDLPPNRLVWISLAALASGQWLAVSWVPLTQLLSTVPLSPADWLTLTAAVLWGHALVALTRPRRWRHGQNGEIGKA